VILPSDHRLAALKAISPRELAGETFVIVSHRAPVLRAIIDNYLKRSRINITPAHEADHVTMGISLIMSTRGVGLLPAYAQNFLPAAVTSRRPLKGDVPTVDLVLGYKSQTSLRSSSFCFRGWTSWSLASRRRRSELRTSCLGMYRIVLRPLSHRPVHARGTCCRLNSSCRAPH
jgi:DNA-binding transcriptional LysR family regulator